MYFHNLNYDGAFILPYFDVKKDSIVTLGASKIIAFTAHVRVSEDRKIKPVPTHFRDSYAMITAPLSKFGKMFNLDVHKEVLPYTFYSQENVRHRPSKIRAKSACVRPRSTARARSFSRPVRAALVA